MDVEPNTASETDQLLAALREIPQETLDRFNAAVADFALELRFKGVSRGQRHGFLHGALAARLLDLDDELPGGR